MEFALNNFLSAMLGGLLVVSGWILTLGRKLQMLENLGNKIDRLETKTDRMTGAIVEMQTHLAGKGFIINQRLAYSSSSPLKLTEFGETMMRESGFSEIIASADKKEYLVGLVRAKEPKTNYDIQQFSMDVMKELAGKNDPSAVPLKNYAYEKGLPLEIILNSAGILLRDEVMKELKFAGSY